LVNKNIIFIWLLSFLVSSNCYSSYIYEIVGNSSTEEGYNIWVPQNILRFEVKLNGTIATFTVRKVDNSKFTSTGYMYLIPGTYENKPGCDKKTVYENSTRTITFQDDQNDHDYITGSKEFYARYETTNQHGTGYAWVGPLTIQKKSLPFPKPTGLYESGLTSNTVTLRWDDINGVTKYFGVLKKGSNSNPDICSTDCISGTLRDNKWEIDTWIEPGTKYYWYVRAHEPREGDWSSSGSFTTKTDPFPKPTGLYESGLTSNTVTLRWDDINGVTKYFGVLKKGSNSSPDICSTDCISGTLRDNKWDIDTWIEPGTKYYWYVRAHEPREGDWSSSRSFTTKTDSQNKSPSSPSIDCPSSAVKNEDVNVSITAGSDPDGDQVKVECTATNANYNNSNPFVSSWYSSGGKTTTANFTFNSSGTQTIWCVTWDEHGEGSSSRNKNITINDPPNRSPSSPSISCSSSAEKNETVNVSVTVGNDPDGDQVKVECTGSNANYNDSNPFVSSWYSSGGKTTTANFTFNSSGTQTIWCVTWDEHGEGSSKSTKLIFIDDEEPFHGSSVTKPTGLSATDITSNTVKLNWSLINGSTEYYCVIHKGSYDFDPDNCSADSDCFEGSLENNYWDITSWLEPDTYYYWQVKVSKPSQSEWSLRDTFRTNPILIKIFIDAANSNVTKVFLSPFTYENKDFFLSSDGLVFSVSPEGLVYIDKNALKPISNVPLMSVCRIDLFNDNYNLIGHVRFNYNKSDFIKEKQIELFLKLHTGLPTNTEQYPGWDYYESKNEYPVSMLIPPDNNKYSIDNSRQPLLLVHGVGGSFPYWDDGSEYNRPLELNKYYDTWQLYYPYDGEIKTSGEILSRAISDILQGNAFNTGKYLAPRINIVAHSMGGLVTRSYIQDDYYRKDIEKFIMLGTPNHGSHAAYRIFYNMYGGFAEVFKNKDNEAPAYKQLSPASNFLINLNLNLIQNEIYNDSNSLVVAGINDMFMMGHDEINNQDDGVVAVSSASLLYKDVPLILVDYDHTQLPCRIPLSIITSFLSNMDDETFISNDAVKGFWKNSKELKPPWSLNEDEGIITMTAKIRDDFFTYPYFYFSGDNVLLISQRGTDLIVGPGSTLANKTWLKKNVNSGHYFSIKNYHDPEINEIGVNFDEGIYDIVFCRFIDGSYPKERYKVVEGFSFKHLQTNMLEVNISDADKDIINASSEIDKEPSLKRMNDKAYFIDNTVESITFLINVDNEYTMPENYNMYLIDPDEIVIDSNYAQINSNITFQENIKHAFAYYHVKNPKSGLWKLKYNPKVSVEVSVPVISDLNTVINIPDKDYRINETIPIEIKIELLPTCSDPLLENNLLFLSTESDTWRIREQLSFNIIADMSGYTTTFLPTQVGTYQIKTSFSCINNSDKVKRSSRKFVDVKNIDNKTIISKKTEEPSGCFVQTIQK